MSVAAFPDPFVHREHRRCRNCRDPWEIILLNGAACPREGFYACTNCHDVPEATPARLALIEAAPQLRLVDDGTGQDAA